MGKINFKKIGDWLIDSVRTNGSTIIGGIAMIGLGVVCRKLGVPYQVLTDPYIFDGAKRHNENMTNFFVMSDDPIEASIGAIYNSTSAMVYDSDKLSSAREIVDILAKHHKEGTLAKCTETYAISVLQAISNTITFPSYKRDITKLIVKIAKGEF